MFLSRASNEARWVFTCASKTHGFSHQYDLCKNKKLLKSGTKAIAMSIHIIAIIACSSNKSFAVQKSPLHSWGFLKIAEWKVVVPGSVLLMTPIV
jgi:hypothetical protein